MRNKIDLLIGCIVILYVILINTIFNNISFSTAFFCGGIILILYHFIKFKIKKNNLFNIFKFLLAIAGIIFFIVEAAIIIFPKNNNEYSNYVIILGAGVNGETPSYTLKQRLDKAIEYSEIQNNNFKIIVSGGQGDKENISEAEAMKRYLIKNGVKKTILMEDKSRNTIENLTFSKKIIEEDSNKKIENINVKIITSDFHALRSNLIAHSLGYNDINFFTNKTLPILIPITYSREFFAFMKYFLFN